MAARAILLFTMAGAAMATGVVAQEGEEAGFLVRLGRDTIAVERFTRTPGRMEGELLRRIPATHVIRYTATLDDDGLPRELVFSITWPGVRAQPSALRGGRIAFGPDSARIELQRDSLQIRMVPAAAGFPALPESYALYELWLSRLRHTGADSMAIVTVAPLGGPAGRIRVAVHGVDSLLVPMFGGTLRLRADRNGALLGVDGRATAVKNDVDRIAPVDIMALAEAFAGADAARGALGTWISPRDTVTANVGGASLLVDYGRPAARGRDVFGRGVLGDTLWRTGANAATQFSTDADLLIGGARVPAGTYTLWTHYDGGRATLIVNTQTGQWGTQYDRSRDLVRIPLQVGELESPVELFTIAVRTAGDDGRGILELRWDRTVLSVALETVGPVSLPE